MALKITKWNWIKSLLFFFDFIIFLINITLFFLTFYLLKTEYDTRASIKLFINPFLVSMINILIDFFMNKTNIIMKYAGHNKYGMITRFLMFYFVLTIIIYSDQREKYLLKSKSNNNKNINILIVFIGLVNIGIIISSMILSFFIIDVQNVNKILVKKKEKKSIEEEMGMLQILIPEKLQ